ncbi:exopolygalacturonase clone GBGE184-like [Salvia miltiorrhiza]|uniref:exopolygalacturonase clone GBGE184-like n=1 Tax=Salvia miltiorrhiza TaxID=226208 RepID=UPI0025AD0CA0|nr:exopolygalacturonase clone GBGE184-like [Salvia miltiorrhiza]
MGISQRNVANMIKACSVLGIACLFMTNIVVRIEASPKGRILQGETVYDITKYGAKGDGTTDDAMSLIQAWRAGCDSAGAARILVPAGKKFMMGEVVMTGPCKAKPPIILDIQGTLNANPDPSSYSNMMWILIEHVNNIKITGGGTLNGQGPSVWKYADEGNHMPVGFTFQSSSNGDISNLNFVDSMGFHTKLIDSINIKVTNLKITAPDDSPNTDGMHFSNATNVEMSDCVIGTGDDCISIGTGSKNLMFRRIKCGPGHGLSVGSLGKRPDELSVGNITFINCSCTGTTNGARIKSYHASPVLTAQTIIYQDIIMDKVKNPIIIDQHYDSKNKAEQSNVKISDVHFRNIKGTTISKVPILLNCSSKYPCDNIELANIDLKPVPPLTETSSACVSATNLKISGTIIPPAPTACTKK